MHRPNMIEHRLALLVGSHRTRRGNTLVLVTAILVLLVIIATAFISRTQGTRTVTSACSVPSSVRTTRSWSASRSQRRSPSRSSRVRSIPTFRPTPAASAPTSRAGSTAPTGRPSPRAPGAACPAPRRQRSGPSVHRGRFQPDPGDYYDNFSGQEGADGLPDGIADFNFAPSRCVRSPTTRDDPNGLLPDILRSRGAMPTRAGSTTPRGAGPGRRQPARQRIR